MYQSLIEIKKKYEELEKQMADPNIASDIKKYTKLMHEANSVKEIVQVFNQYLKLENQKKEAKELLASESDKDLIEMANSDLNEANKEMPLLAEELKILLLPSDPNDSKNVIVEIRGAAGGDEANIFAGDLFDIYSKWAADNDMKIKVLETSRGTSGGYSLITFSVEGEKAYSKLKYESGVHRVQRIPSTETQGRVHTSTATVTVMPEADESVDIELIPSELKIDTYRSSGAGGQSVNTTDSAVRITHIPTGIWASSQDGKSQISNKELAMKVLKSRLYEKQLQEEREKAGEFRKLAGSGARSEKIRTYNYPQDRVTDHRIGFSTSLKSIESGKLNPIIDALLAEEQKEKIKEAGL